MERGQGSPGAIPRHPFERRSRIQGRADEDRRLARRASLRRPCLSVPGRQERNLDSAIARYEALTGERVEARFVMPERGLTIARLGPVTIIAGTEQALALLREVQATFTVDSLAEFEAHLRASGATILQPPSPTPAGENMVAKDVDGAVFEFVEPRSKH